MKPLVHIQCVAANAYTYQITANGAQAAGDSGTFDSLEHCLFDAGASLDQYFANVELKLDGRHIGQYATCALRRDPCVVAQRMRRHVQR
ncbi:hypothetical protein [Variovorax sp.]|uniref:hypothetical protein n=1 Tax=Variovorax sp. TaxID=1871043 RepID=UPI002D42CECB|nr:hypothetical protein [Variovorax sp.]HYP83642.1 hypothetical protein [Variovorax sp.]